jgi:hypothetical protein
MKMEEMMKPRLGGAIALAALVACTVADNRGVAAEIHDGVHPLPAVKKADTLLGMSGRM